MSDAQPTTDHLDGSVDNDNRKRLLALGGVVGAAVVVGGAAWAATSFFATGAQPAEALPASAIAYASIDLDPSGGQKIEAIRTLRKFPAFNEEIDLDTDDDLRERIFTEILAEGECEGLDFKADVDPWLGARFGIAAVEAGEEEPSVVVVGHVTDAGKAEEGMTTLVETCGGDAEAASPTSGNWIVEGDWVVAAETREIAEQAVEETKQSPLSDKDDFTRWTEEAGDPGIVSIYVAKEAAEYFSDIAGAGRGMLGFGPSFPGATDGSDSVADGIEDFEGMAATLRFSGGALELETATSANQDQQAFFASQVGVDLVSSLPADTVAAIGLGLEDGWFGALAEQIVASEPDMTLEEFYQEGRDTTGLDIPDDVETLFGEGAALALGSGIDVDALVNGGLLELPLGVKIQGDVDEIQGVLDKLEPQLGPDESGLLETSSSDEVIAFGPDAEFRDKLIEDGSLGDDKVFEDLMSGADDAQAVFFVNFNADDDWLVRAVEDSDAEFAANLAPLAAFGASGWFDDGVAHTMIKLTTD